MLIYNAIQHNGMNYNGLLAVSLMIVAVVMMGCLSVPSDPPVNKGVKVVNYTTEKSESLNGGGSSVGVGAFETPTPTPVPTYVTCSEYHKVVDKWKTPSGSFVKLDDNETVALKPRFNLTYMGKPTTYGDDYEHITIGEYATLIPTDDKMVIYSEALNGARSVKLKPVSESASGYRDACQIIS